MRTAAGTPRRRRKPQTILARRSPYPRAMWGFVPPPAQEQMIAGLQDNPSVTLHRYDGVDHAFARPGGQHFNQAAADLAFSRTADFFKEHLS